MHLPSRLSSFFFFNDTATTEIYTLSLHDALPIFGVYIAWRGRDLTVPGLSLLTFWSRKSAGQIVASQNGCLAAISELALAARAPDKKYHHCVLLGQSFGGVVLWDTISHFILDAGSN